MTTRILMAEHDMHDVEIVHYALKKGGINYISEVVQTEDDYRKALKIFKPDVILSDYTFPSFAGPIAFKIREQDAPGTPFIFVSGTIGEEKSIELLKNGVTDYALKDNLLSLPLKIKRALKESKEETDKMKTAKALKNALTDLQKIMNSSLDVICTIDEEGKFVNVSAASENVWGFKPDELIGRKYLDLVFEEDIEKTLEAAKGIMNGQSVTIFENRYVHFNGNTVPIIWSAKWDDTDMLMYCIAKDITAKKRLEQAFENERQRFYDLFFRPLLVWACSKDLLMYLK